MSYAIAYLGTLAFVAFVLWMRQRRHADVVTARIEEIGDGLRILTTDAKVNARQAMEIMAAMDRLAALESTVSTLAVGAGLKPTRPVEPKA